VGSGPSSINAAIHRGVLGRIVTAIAPKVRSSERKPVRRLLGGRYRRDHALPMPFVRARLPAGTNFEAPCYEAKYGWRG
jgi:hypothetical protein